MELNGKQLPLMVDTGVHIPNARQREYFPTPPGVAQFAVQRMLPNGLQRHWRLRVLDPGASETGVFGQALHEQWPDAYVFGVDLPGVVRAPGYNGWRANDFMLLARRWLAHYPGIKFDVVMGNPWFSEWEELVAICHDLVRYGGYIVLFLRLAVLAGQNRGMHFWRQFPLYDMAVSSRRPSFTGDGVSDQKTEYALFCWRKGFRGPFRNPFDYLHEDTWT